MMGYNDIIEGFGELFIIDDKNKKYDVFFKKDENNALSLFFKDYFFDKHNEIDINYDKFYLNCKKDKLIIKIESFESIKKVGNNCNYITHMLSCDFLLMKDCNFFDTDGISSVEFNITGLSKWIGSRINKVTEGDDCIEIKCSKDDSFEYKTEKYLVKIRRDVLYSKDSNFNPYNVSISQEIYISICAVSGIKLNIKEVVLKFYQIYGLFSTLIDSDFYFDYPVAVFNGEKRAEYFFSRSALRASMHESHWAPVYFDGIKNDFGTFLEKWFYYAENHSPLINMFCGVRRNKNSYIESNFMSLIFGLEAFHKKEFIGKNKKKLKERVYDIINFIQFGFDEKMMIEFSSKCSDIRNKIAHEGGDHLGDSSFLSEIYIYGNAVEYIYYFYLLSKIGFSVCDLNKMKMKPYFYSAKRNIFEKVNLRD